MTSPGTIEVVISNEVERSVLIRALWRLAAHQLGDRFDDLVYLPAGPEEVAEIDRRAAGFLAVRRAIDAAKDAELGSVELFDVPFDEIAGELGSVAQSISEDESFWEVAADRRNSMLAEYDAAIDLRQSHEAEAVT